ncbi:MAG TPA: c-type cytochrome [Usitatibacter sp.]|jgi:cytochrome c553|nr:c-type cytochrome [Usitatibacter sp.]
MKMRATRALAGLLAASGAALALAQQPPPPPPAFAPSNLGEAGARALAANCGACHGTAGRPAAGSSVPALAGRTAADIVQVMGQFKSGARPATVMHQIAKGYSDDEIAAIAAYFEKQR